MAGVIVASRATLDAPGDWILRPFTELVAQGLSEEKGLGFRTTTFVCECEMPATVPSLTFLSKSPSTYTATL